MNGDGKERTVSIPLNFLDKNTAYQATILRDLAEKNDGWSVETRKVTSGSPFLHHAHQRRRNRPHGSLRNAASCPRQGKRAPPLLPSSKAERRKTMFIRRYTAVSKKE